MFPNPEVIAKTSPKSMGDRKAQTKHFLVSRRGRFPEFMRRPIWHLRPRTKVSFEASEGVKVKAPIMSISGVGAVEIVG